MKRIALILMMFVLAIGVFAGGQKDEEAGGYRIAWYASAVHPYFDEVQSGVKAFEADMGIAVHQQIGPDWTQDSQTQNIESLAAKGYKAFSVYPSDPSAANGLYEELTERGIYVANFGTSTSLPTPASFAVATDVKHAAMVATEKLIDLIGGEGQILNVLEVVTDANTILRKEGIEEVVAKHPKVEIIQEIGDITSVEEATEKLGNALAATITELDGVICTGYTTTVAATQILSEHNNSGAERISFVGIDTDAVVLNAIKDGSIDATIAQNPYGHGYISCMLLKHLLDGFTPKEGKYFVNAGQAVVTKENVDSFSADLSNVTRDILGSLTTEYLTK